MSDEPKSRTDTQALELMRIKLGATIRRAEEDIRRMRATLAETERLMAQSRDLKGRVSATDTRKGLGPAD